MTIVLAGGSGFLGRALARRLTRDGHQVVVLTRRQPQQAAEAQWQPNGSAGNLSERLEGVDAVVNLAGEGIADRRWSAARKEALRTSRVLSTRTLVAAIAKCERPPAVFISSSGVGYYGPRGNEVITESTEPGTDFLSRMAVDWEQEAQAVTGSRTRLAIIRTGLVLSGEGGALAKMLLPFKLGLGGPLGSGTQYMPWVHIDDHVSLTMWLMATPAATGAFNVSAPNPVTNREFTRELGRALRRPAVLPAPAFALRIMLGEMAELLLTGQRAVPAHAEQLGFRFAYDRLDHALQSLNL
jgi:hypothetical protein